jgi:mono/diheme cytochrome c family protein
MYKGDKNKFGAAHLEEMEKRKSRSYIKTPDEIKDNLGKGNEMEGLVLFNAYCASCHQGNGKGDNNRYPPLVGSDWVTGSGDQLIGVILNGLQGEIKVNGITYNGVMPAFGSVLDDHAVASISTYVKKRFNKEKTTVSSAAVTKIRAASNHK